MTMDPGFKSVQATVSMVASPTTPYAVLVHDFVTGVASTAAVIYLNSYIDLAAGGWDFTTPPAGNPIAAAAVNLVFYG